MRTASPLKPVLCLALLAGAVSTAQAASGSLDFTLDAIPLAANAEQAGAPGTVGYWLPDNAVTAGVSSVDGTGEHRRYESGTSDLSDPAALNAAPFGQIGYALPALPGISGAVQASVSGGHIGMSWQNETELDSGSAYAAWSRSFALDPYASVTLAGFVSMVTPHAGAPRSLFEIDTFYPDEWVHSGTLNYSAPWYAEGDVWVYAHILDSNPLDPTSPPQGRVPNGSDFSYSVDSFGHIAVTVHNSTAQTLFGSFQLTLAQAWTAAPIPEPSSGLMMAFGVLGLVGVKRKRRFITDALRSSLRQ